MDIRLKGYTGGQPDLVIVRGLPNGVQDVLAIELKNANGRGKVSFDQMEYIDNLEGKCKVPTIVGCDYDDIILHICDRYITALVRARVPALADKPRAINFVTNENLKNG